MSMIAVFILWSLKCDLCLSTMLHITSSPQQAGGDGGRVVHWTDWHQA